MSFAALAAQNAQHVFDAFAEDALLHPLAGGEETVRVILDRPGRAQAFAGMELITPQITARFLAGAPVTPVKKDRFVLAGRVYQLLGDGELVEDGTIWEFNAEDEGAAP